MSPCCRFVDLSTLKKIDPKGQGPNLSSVEFARVEERAWFPPKGSSMVLPPWGGLNRMVFVLRGWGGHLGTLLIAHPTVLLRDLRGSVVC